MIPLAGGPTVMRATRFMVGLLLIWSSTICAPGKSAPALLRLAIENYRKKLNISEWCIFIMILTQKYNNIKFCIIER